MTEKKSIAIGADHLGLELKNTLVEHLKAKGYEVKDMGAIDHNPVDYPDIGVKVAEAVGYDGEREPVAWSSARARSWVSG